MIVLHYRAIPDLRRQVQHAVAAPSAPARHPPTACRPCTATTARVRAGLAGPTRPRSPSGHTAPCLRLAHPGPIRMTRADGGGA
jgi:hypothetical protein